MNILITDEQSDMKLSIPSVERAVEAILNFLEIKTDEISLCFVDRETICALHDEHFDDPSFTDCITFPIDGNEPSPGYHILGEVIICPEAAKIHAAEEGVDPYGELLLYIVHGVCHLIGFDDLTDDERQAMREEEACILAHLKKESIDLQTK